MAQTLLNHLLHASNALNSDGIPCPWLHVATLVLCKTAPGGFYHQ